MCTECSHVVFFPASLHNAVHSFVNIVEIFKYTYIDISTNAFNITNESGFTQVFPEGEKSSDTKPLLFCATWVKGLNIVWS